MKSSRYFLSSLLWLLIVTGVCSTSHAQDSSLSVVDRGSYYEVVVDYTSGVSRYAMGRELMQKTEQLLPDYEQLLDSYLVGVIADQSSYDALLDHVGDIKPQIPQEYREEMDGMASRLSGGDADSLGDGKLSVREFYLMQLITDVLRPTQCSAISVYGSRSATGHTMTARLLDWYDGPDNQLAQIQAVITVKNGSKSICSIGYLGFMGIITGFNESGIFAGILDSPSGFPYSSKGKRSYALDLRYALENRTTLSDAAGFMTDTSRHYAYNHLIFLSHKNESAVLENNFSGIGTNVRRALRRDSSALNPGILWGFNDAVAAVNSFLLAGNCDNHTGALFNTARWSSIRTQLQHYSGAVTLDELKLIASFDNGDGPGNQSNGDIYNNGNQQIVIFRPDSLYLEVAFKPRSGVLPTDPVFERIPVHIGSNASPVREGAPAVPESFALEQNYPNPFNPSTTISYQLNTGSIVLLTIYDPLGREIKTLVNERQMPGEHSVTFDAGGLPSGVYFYRLQAGTFTETRKLMLVK